MKFMITFAAALLTGCSTSGDYYKSVDNSNARNVELAQAHAQAEAARYQALARIAETGDSASRVAAAMALAMGGQGLRTQAAVAQPLPNEALQWASVLVPGVTQGLGIYYNAKTNINANDNATALGINTNGTFAQFASEINSPVVVKQPAPLVVEQPAPVIVRPEIVNPVVVDPVVVPAAPVVP